MDGQDVITGYVGGSCGGITNDFYFEANFEPGSYLVAAEIDWKNNQFEDYVFSAYGDNFVDMVRYKRDKPHYQLI